MDENRSEQFRIVGQASGGAAIGCKETYFYPFLMVVDALYDAIPEIPITVCLLTFVDNEHTSFNLLFWAVEIPCTVSPQVVFLEQFPD